MCITHGSKPYSRQELLFHTPDLSAAAHGPARKLSSMERYASCGGGERFTARYSLLFAHLCRLAETTLISCLELLEYPRSDHKRGRRRIVLEQARLACQECKQIEYPLRRQCHMLRQRHERALNFVVPKILKILCCFTPAELGSRSSDENVDIVVCLCFCIMFHTGGQIRTAQTSFGHAVES